MSDIFMDYEALDADGHPVLAMGAVDEQGCSLCDSDAPSQTQLVGELDGTKVVVTGSGALTDALIERLDETGLEAECRAERKVLALSARPKISPPPVQVVTPFGGPPTQSNNWRGSSKKQRMRRPR